MASAPLSGKTIVITRPRPQARELTSLLTRFGANVKSAPTIKIAPPASPKPMDSAIRRLSEYDTIIFTSSNAVVRFFERAKKLLARRPKPPKRLYAIGPKTAEELKQHGWAGVRIPETYEGEALARFLGPVRGRRILIPRARVARDILPKLLRGNGASVDIVEAYQTLPDRAGIASIQKIVTRRSADFVTFTSSSTAEHFIRAVSPPAARRFFQTAVAASIGPITSSTLRRFGVKNIVQARIYTSAGLARAILDYEKNRGA